MSGGNTLKFEGEYKDGAMRYTGSTPKANGHTRLERLTFTPLPEIRVHQVWDQSIDGGKTWTVAFDGVYVPRSKTPELMPREQETALALSAAPKHLRNGATVYVL